MKLLHHVVYKLIVPLVLGVLVIGAVAVVVIFTQSPGWINPVADVLAATSLAGFTLRASTAARVADRVISAHLANTQVASTYIRNVLGLGKSQASNEAINTTTPYTSYFAAQLGDPPVDPPLPGDPNLYSAYYSNSIKTSADLSSNLNNVNTTTFDNAFRPLAINSPSIQAVQAGFELDNGWRIYPLVYNISRYNPRTQFTCNATDAPADVQGVEGYIARCRNWYIDAVAADSGNTSVYAAGLGSPVLSVPYVSASSTGQVLITGSQAFYNGSARIGVVGLQIRISGLTAQVSGVSILTRGYVFMIDTSGNIITYPTSQTSINVYAQVTSISWVEFNNDTTLTNNFFAAVNSSAASGSSPRTFYKTSGGESWTLAAAAVPNSNYLVVAVAPESDLSSAADSIRRTATIFGATATALILVTVVVGALTSFYVTRRESQKVLQPIEELGAWLDRLAKSDLEHDLGNQYAVTRELGVVNDNFKNLLTAIRFGNSAYYADDLMRALENYEAAEVMMVRLKNERGRGVCLNNKGNVFKQLDNRTQEAIDAYSRAILIAEALIASETELERQRRYKITLAGRLSNLGVLYKDLDVDERVARRGKAGKGEIVPLTANQQRAVELFTRALELHRGVDNIEGIAQTSGNLGQLYLDVNDYARAETLIRDAYDMVRRTGERAPATEEGMIAMQYACMNMGYLADRMGKPVEAVTWYTYVLQRFAVVVAFVQRTCAAELVRICEEPGEAFRPELANAVREVGAQLFGELVTVPQGSKAAATAGRGPEGQLRTFARAAKNVWFVLDVSGSMSGDFIRACRQSMKDIIKDHCSPLDAIGLTTFSTSVRTVFELQTRTDAAVEDMLRLIDSRTECDGMTAFYSALVKTLVQARRGGTGDARRVNWVVALTDGGDNSSGVGDLERARKLLRENPGFGLIIITVGSLPNAAQIQSLIDAVSAGPGRAVLIGADASGEAIKNAFGKVVRVLGGALVVESL
ncbi:hypothetical protein HK405_015132 [Cladochytrium tenue]|nr:hypothetical protein HK405_015132 [Cladochytrium tenue]